MSIYNERQKRQEEDALYRKAAARLSGGTVSLHASANRNAGNDGAFVDVIVWVPKAEMEKERGDESGGTVLDGAAGDRPDVGRA